MQFINFEGICKIQELFDRGTWRLKFLLMSFIVVNELFLSLYLINFVAKISYYFHQKNGCLQKSHGFKLLKISTMRYSLPINFKWNVWFFFVFDRVAKDCF